MKLYKTKKNCGKLLLGILAFCTGMILLTGCGSSSEQNRIRMKKQQKRIRKRIRFRSDYSGFFCYRKMDP